MITRYFGGVVPNGLNESPRLHAIFARERILEANKYFDAFDFSEALKGIWEFIASVDAYITETAPWKLGALEDETGRAQLGDILYTCSESIRIITALVAPV